MQKIMIKSQDKLAPIFRSLHPDESVMTKAVSASAQEAAEKWPLFRVLAPKKTMRTPALSEVDKQNRLSPHFDPLPVQPPVLAAASLGEQLADGLSKMTRRKKPASPSPKRVAHAAEPSPAAQAKPIPQAVPARMAQPVSEKHPPLVVTAPPEVASEQKTKPATATKLPKVSVSEHNPAPRVLPAKAELPPQTAKKPPAPAKVHKESVSEPVFHKAPVQPVAVALKPAEPAEPAAPIQLPKTSGSIKSLLHKLQNPASATPMPEVATTATVKAPAFLNRLFKK